MYVDFHFVWDGSLSFNYSTIMVACGPLAVNA